MRNYAEYTYQEASDLLDRARNRDAGKPIANNTRLFDRGDHIAIRLHNTDIVELYPDGTYVLRTDGWRTVTTKARINDYSPASVWTEKGIWYMGSWDTPRSERIIFEEGVRVDSDGNVVSGGIKGERRLAAREKQVKRINAYVKEFVRRALSGKLEPELGDCFLCQCKDTKNSDHVREHIRESYYVGSMLFAAIKFHEEKGPSQLPPAFHWGIQDLWGKQPSPVPGLGGGDFLKRNMTRVLKVYIKHHMGFQA